MNKAMISVAACVVLCMLIVRKSSAFHVYNNAYEYYCMAGSGSVAYLPYANSEGNAQNQARYDVLETGKVNEFDKDRHNFWFIINHTADSVRQTFVVVKVLLVFDKSSDCQDSALRLYRNGARSASEKAMWTVGDYSCGEYPLSKFEYELEKPRFDAELFASLHAEDAKYIELCKKLNASWHAKPSEGDCHSWDRRFVFDSQKLKENVDKIKNTFGMEENPFVAIRGRLLAFYTTTGKTSGKRVVYSLYRSGARYAYMEIYSPVDGFSRDYFLKFTK